MILLPAVLQFLLLALIGAAAGALINYGIYAWTYFLKRPISPWQSPPPQFSPRQKIHYWPIIGWLSRAPEEAILGKWFWLRPMLIEVAWVIGLPCFFFWQQQAGLIGEHLRPQPDSWAGWAETWFWIHAVLLGLMFIATFIDFDERTIPDAVTIPGTLFALVVLTLFPWGRLPEKVSGLAGLTIQPLSYANGRPIPFSDLQPEILLKGASWHTETVGLVLAVGLFLGWTLALMPKICTLRFGWRRGVRILWASCLRPPRKTVCSIRSRQRRPFAQTVGLLVLAVVGAGLICLVRWCWSEPHWDSLFGSLFGLGFGGLMIWSIRIVGHLALGREAMGFGDVTLMAMVGAFLGWQVTLLALPAAAVLALFFVVATLVFTRDSMLAFGPYLCMGTALVLFSWSTVWPALEPYFALGEWLFAILISMLVLMGAMLLGLQLVKRVAGYDR